MYRSFKIIANNNKTPNIAPSTSTIITVPKEMAFLGKKYKRLFYLTKMYSKYLDEPHKKEILTINNIESKLWLFEVVPFLSWTVLNQKF